MGVLADVFSPLTPTHHAMLHAVSTYLTYIKDRLSSAVNDCVKENAPGWTKWNVALREVGELAETLCEVICWVGLHLILSLVLSAKIV
jgi:hypothetical protein